MEHNKMNSLNGRDFVTTQDWTTAELTRVIELAGELKAARREGRVTDLLLRKTLYMIFFDSSTRTRNSFETGMTQLGGHAIFLSPDKMQISHGENARDTANVLSRYGEGIAIRHCAHGEGNGYLREVAEHASIPVISMQCDVYHPCQIMADYLTISERFGETRGLKVGVRLDLCAQLRAATVGTAEPDPDAAPIRHRRHPGLPAGVQVDAGNRGSGRANAEAAGARFEISHHFEDAFTDADAVVPKSWGPLITTREVGDRACD